MKEIAKFIAKQMAWFVLAVALLALFVPDTFTWIPTSSINWMLGIIMFGMGMTLKPADFGIVFSKPKAVLIGCAAQFTIMPLLTWTLCRVFQLPAEIAIGVILVGCCPGGTAYPSPFRLSANCLRSFRMLNIEKFGSIMTTTGLNTYITTSKLTVLYQKLCKYE